MEPGVINIAYSHGRTFYSADPGHGSAYVCITCTDEASGGATRQRSTTAEEAKRRMLEQMGEWKEYLPIIRVRAVQCQLATGGWMDGWMALRTRMGMRECLYLLTSVVFSWGGGQALDADSIVERRILDLPPLDTWQRGRVVIIGGEAAGGGAGDTHPKSNTAFCG